MKKLKKLGSMSWILQKSQLLHIIIHINIKKLMWLSIDIEFS